MADDVAALRARVAALESELAAARAGAVAASAPAPARPSLAEWSAEVTADNPYSRLLALQRMGIVPNYRDIRDKTVVIVGAGGVGSVVAEALTRCGVGRLVLYDYDRVELANMNRLFYRPEHVRLTKVDAAAAQLREINPDVDVVPVFGDVTSPAVHAGLCERIAHGGLPRRDAGGSASESTTQGPPVDLVLSCVDNYGARIALNRACLALRQPWMESGVSEDAVSGHIQTLLPGRTACFECAPPLVVASGIDESTLKREGVCAASLPTVMGVIAGLLAHNALKHLLGFGRVSFVLGYNSLADHFYSEALLRPNPGCTSEGCRRAQADALAASGGVPWAPPEWVPPSAAGAGEPVDHGDNEWAIEVVAGEQAEEEVEGVGAGSGAAAAASAAAGGRAAPSAAAPAAVAGSTSSAAAEAVVDDLMAELARLQQS
jgi:ubiquitin-like modifier-activating enzyme 5